MGDPRTDVRKSHRVLLRSRREKMRNKRIPGRGNSLGIVGRSEEKVCMEEALSKPFRGGLSRSFI